MARQMEHPPLAEWATIVNHPQLFENQRSRGSLKKGLSPLTVTLTPLLVQESSPRLPCAGCTVVPIARLGCKKSGSENLDSSRARTDSSTAPGSHLLLIL